MGLVKYHGERKKVEDAIKRQISAVTGHEAGDVHLLTQRHQDWYESYEQFLSVLTVFTAVALLIARSDSASWPLAAQWMLRAIERHSLPLIPFLAPAAAARLQKDYAARYRPWDRLPAQKEVLKALRDAC